MHILVLMLLVNLWISGCSPQPIDVDLDQSTINGINQPEWVPRPKRNPAYYQGVGISKFTKDLDTSIKSAKQKAIFDLASQIIVTVQGSIVDSVWEEMGISKAFIEQVIKTSVKNQALPELEIVDTWVKPPKSEVYVYVKLKKDTYEKYNQKRKETALKYALQYLSDGDVEYQRTNFGLALQYYLTAFYYSRFLLGDFKEVEYPPYSGNYVNINSKLTSTINILLKNISINVTNVPKYIKAYSRKSAAVMVQIKTNIPSQPNKPLAYFPVLFHDTNEAFDLKQIAITNENGQARTYLKVKDPQQTMGLLSVELALDSIYIDKKNLDTNLPILYSQVFQTPFKEMEIPIMPTYLYMISQEEIDGEPVEEVEKFVTRSLMESLSNQGGFVFIRDELKADYIINLRVNCKFQTTEQGLYVFMAYTSIDIFTNTPKKKVFSKTYEPVEGFGKYLRQGGIETLEKAGIVFNQNYAPEVIDFLIQ